MTLIQLIYKNHFYRINCSTLSSYFKSKHTQECIDFLKVCVFTLFFHRKIIELEQINYYFIYDIELC